MLTLQTRLRPNDQDVAAKVLEGEAIIINLSNGIYYSLDNVGGFIWEQIAAGLSLGEIVATVTAKYDVSAPQAQADLEQLAAQLVQEGIVAPDHDDARAARSLGHSRRCQAPVRSAAAGDLPRHRAFACARSADAGSP